MKIGKDRIGPSEGNPGQLAYTFLNCILSTSFISVSIFSVCCYSRVSISMVGPERQRGAAPADLLKLR